MAQISLKRTSATEVEQEALLHNAPQPLGDRARRSAGQCPRDIGHTVRGLPSRGTRSATGIPFDPRARHHRASRLILPPDEPQPQGAGVRAAWRRHQRQGRCRAEPGSGGRCVALVRLLSSFSCHFPAPFGLWLLSKQDLRWRFVRNDSYGSFSRDFASAEYLIDAMKSIY